MPLQEYGRLLGCEGQFRVPDLRQLTGCPVTVHRQQRLGAGDEDEAHSRSGMVQDEFQLLRDLRRAHAVVFVEHDDRGPVASAQLGGEPCQQCAVHPARVGGTANVARDRHARGPQGLEYVRPEHPGLLIRRVGGEPGDRLRQPSDPLGDQQGLPRPGRSVDDRQGVSSAWSRCSTSRSRRRKVTGLMRQGEPRAQKRVSHGIDPCDGRPLAALLDPSHGARHYPVRSRAALFSLLSRPSHSSSGPSAQHSRMNSPTRTAWAPYGLGPVRPGRRDRTRGRGPRLPDDRGHGWATPVPFSPFTAAQPPELTPVDITLTPPVARR